MDLMVGLSAISKALDIAKALRDFENKFNDAQFRIQIADLYVALSEAKISLAEAQDLLAEKEKEIRKLKEIENGKMRVVNYKGYNFGIDEAGSSIGRPFCPVCEKTKGIQIQITRATSTIDICPSCKAPYKGYPYSLPSDHLPPKD